MRKKSWKKVAHETFRLWAHEENHVKRKHRKRKKPTDLERTLYEFGCRMIFATSPQGKGRIERMWNTFQDRLIPEIRRQNIKSIPKANDYIWNHYILDHNKRFGVLATDPIPAWKSLDSFTKANLENKFYMQEFRKILN